MIEARPGSGPTRSGQPGSGQPDRGQPDRGQPDPGRLGGAIDTRRAELRAKTVLSQARVLVATSRLATASTEWETRVIGFLDQAIGN